MMPTLGAPELIIILVIIVLIFGVGKLPEVGQALGKGIREFRGAADGLEDEDEKPSAAAARPAVEAPRPAGAVDTPRQPAAPVAAPAAPAAPVAATTAPAAPVAAAPAAPVAASPSTVSYTVVSGDTPEVVAKSHGITVEELMAANGWGSSERTLYAGDKIQVPAKNTTA
jgi:sec-independent protein translocase protein TatA